MKAEEMVIPFGKYRGKTLAQIADDDILYLDWLRGEKEKESRLYEALCVVFNETIERVKEQEI